MRILVFFVPFLLIPFVPTSGALVGGVAAPVVAAGPATVNGCPSSIVFTAYPGGDQSTGTFGMSGNALAPPDSCGSLIFEQSWALGDCHDLCSGYCQEFPNTTVECHRTAWDDDTFYARLDPDGAFFLRWTGVAEVTGQLVRTPF